MTPDALNTALAERGVRFALAVTGAGMTGATDFFRASGASRFLDEICIPYSSEATARLLGAAPKKHVCLDTAFRLAEAMSSRCFQGQPKTVALGVEGALFCEGQRPERANVVHYAAIYRDLQGEERSCSTMLVFLPDSTRESQERAASRRLHDFMLECASLACS